MNTNINTNNIIKDGLSNNIKSTVIKGVNPQLIYQYKKRLYYESIIKKNQAAMNAPLKPKYSPLYFQTGYNLIYFPAKESIPY